MVAFPVLAVTFLQAFGTATAIASAGTPPISDQGRIWLALLSSAFTLALAVLISRLFLRSTGETSAKESSVPFPKGIGSGLLFGAGTTLLVLGLAWTLQKRCDAWGYETARQEVFGWLGDTSLSLSLRVFLAVNAVLIAPVLEECAYRGVLFREASRNAKGWVSPALVTAVYFSLMHLNAFAFLPLLVFGFCTAAAYCKTRTLATPITMHIFFNTASLGIWLCSPSP